jgi:hypothetical protein
MTPLLWANYRQPWSADDIELLIAEIGMGRDIPAVARKLGRSEEVVRQAASRLDLLSSGRRQLTV